MQYRAQWRKTQASAPTRTNISKASLPALPENAALPCLTGRQRRLRSRPSRGRDPTAIHAAAQERAVAAGGKLVPEELAKREMNAFDIWDEMVANAAAGRFPKGLDVFRHKFHGLFYVAPNQDAFSRLRLPGGLLSAPQASRIPAAAPATASLAAAE